MHAVCSACHCSCCSFQQKAIAQLPSVCYACRFLDSGGVYKLVFGPKAFIVVSDPVVVRHLLKVLHSAANMCKHLTPAWSVLYTAAMTDMWSCLKTISMRCGSILALLETKPHSRTCRTTCSLLLQHLTNDVTN